MAQCTCRRQNFLELRCDGPFQHQAAEPQNSPIVIKLARETLEIIIGYVYQIQTV